MEESQAQATAITDPLFCREVEDIMHRLAMTAFRDHVARVLGPSPLSVRLRNKPLLSKEEAEKIADEVVMAMEKEPDRGAAFMESIYMPEGDDE